MDPSPFTHSLSGKTALVTGAGHRVGRAIALALARAGADVAVHYHTSVQPAQETVDEIRNLGVRAFSCRADLTCLRETDRLIHQVMKRGNPVDILVNNASEYKAGTGSALTEKEFADSANLHALSPLSLTFALARQKREACVVNILDARTAANDSRHAAYYIGKGILSALTEVLARELAPCVRVNAVAPGFVLPASGTRTKTINRCRKANPLARMGSPEEVAQAVLFLACMPFVTGQTIYVDGGYHLKNIRSAIGVTRSRGAAMGKT